MTTRIRRRATRPTPALPPFSLPLGLPWMDRIVHSMSGYANTGIEYCLSVEAQEWCFDTIGPWIIREHDAGPAYSKLSIITFQSEEDRVAFKMRFHEGA
jgi:hypothetical protein